MHSISTSPCSKLPPGLETWLTSELGPEGSKLHTRGKIQCWSGSLACPLGADLLLPAPGHPPAQLLPVAPGPTTVHTSLPATPSHDLGQENWLKAYEVQKEQKQGCPLLLAKPPASLAIVFPEVMRILQVTSWPVWPGYSSQFKSFRASCVLAKDSPPLMAPPSCSGD